MIVVMVTIIENGLGKNNALGKGMNQFLPTTNYE